MARKQQTDPTQPPPYLGEIEAALWRRLQVEYDLRDAPALVLLEQACRCLRLVRQCREAVELEGLQTVAGKEHPLLKVWRDAEKQATIALKALNLDYTSPASEPLQKMKPYALPGRR